MMIQQSHRARSRRRQQGPPNNDNDDLALALSSSARKDRRLPPLDPILTLQVAMDHHTGAETPMGSAASRSSIASVCFLPQSAAANNGGSSLQSGIEHNDDDDDDDDDEDHDHEDEDDSSSSSSDGEELQFRCQSLLQSEAKSAYDPTRQARQTAAAARLLHGRYLASCHANGECLLWDLNQQKIVQQAFIKSRGGAGWMLRRLGEDHNNNNNTNQLFLYQTRDPRGTVSIHTWDNIDGTATEICSFATFSQTFCSATPCQNNSNLLGLPSSNDTEVTIRDLRMNPSSTPVAVFSGSGNDINNNEDDDHAGSSFAVGRKHGMLTSLAFAEAPSLSSNNHPIVACGMESGTVFFHDLRRLGACSSMKLATDPVLALDMAPSYHPAGGIVAIAGMAGENQTQKDLAQDEQGTVAVLKGTIVNDDNNNTGSPPKVRLRSRLPTCRPQGPGKPGVSLCRFQPGDARLFAVGGWDQRVRILDRSANSKSPLKAILRGHDASVNALDWAPDSGNSGLFATGAADGKIHLWRCFSQKDYSNVGMMV